MLRRTFLALTGTSLLGCRSVDTALARAMNPGPHWDVATDAERKKAEAVDRLSSQIAFEPDLPAWHAQREKIALAVGDRIFNRPFTRVFDSLTVALATLGSRVDNMKRDSGYITASIPELDPMTTQALYREGAQQYAIAKGFDPSAADASGQRWELGSMDAIKTSLSARSEAGLTASLVRQSQTQTKVKLRFDNLYYPGLVSAYYKLVWTAVDKQMFLDQALD